MTTTSSAETPTLLERIGGFVSEFDLEQVPDDVIEKAKIALLHNMTVTMAGYRPDEPALQMARSLNRVSSVDGTRLLVDGDHVGLEAATLATAAMMHARTQDDSQFSAQLHPGCTTLPAAIALGDHLGSSGRELLESMIVGYEVATSLGRAISRESTNRGFRATSVYGPFGSAAACAHLLHLATDEVVSAFGLVASFGGGVSQTWAAGGGEWQYQPGVAGRNGLVSALLASRGVTGAADALEGADGFYRAFTGEAHPELPGIVDLGSHWNMLDVAFKVHPVCAINQTPVDLVDQLRERVGGVNIADVGSVTLRLAPHQAAYPAIDNPGPFSGAGDALMSAQFCVGVALSRGGIRMADLTSDLTAQERQLVARIEIVGDAAHAENSSTLEVEVNGTAHTVSHDATMATTFWGRQEATHLLRTLVPELPISADAVSRLENVCLDLESSDVRTLVDTLIVARN